MLRHALTLTVALAAGAASAACPEDAAIEAFLEARAAGEAAAPPMAAGGSLQDALCAQRKIVARLEGENGPVVGWKAGLTSEKAQAAFGVSEPVLGALLEGMLLEDGATVSAAAAHRALFEADLIVEIAEDGVNDAQTPAEALEHIRGVRPFLELPALVVGADQKLDGPAITSINVGAWRGVMGDLVEIPAGEEGVAMLADFTARLTDAEGREISVAPGRAVLGHPLEAVIWVSDMLERQGKRLKAGDFVSVGSIGPLNPMKAGMSVTLIYEGLPGEPSVSASFE